MRAMATTARLLAATAIYLTLSVPAAAQDYGLESGDSTPVANPAGSTIEGERTGIYAFGPEQLAAAEASKKMYQESLRAAGHGDITTEIREAPEFYYAEDYHQQYLGKNPNGYCGLGGTGVSCPIGLGAKANA